MHAGLCSITFRKLKPEEIVRLVSDAGLAGIEWGGDIHVPHGNIVQAEAVRKLTEGAGLKVSSYGSYYRVGEAGEPPFEQVLATAVALGAPTIRVWAGKRGAEEADAEQWRAVERDAECIAEAALRAQIEVAYEFHGGTLTATAASARKLLMAATQPNLRTYWQPPEGMASSACLVGLRSVLPWLANIHVFHWGAGFRDRRALSEGQSVWEGYLAEGAVTGREQWALLEFVQDDAPEAFRRDAATLLSILDTACGSRGKRRE